MLKFNRASRIAWSLVMLCSMAPHAPAAEVPADWRGYGWSGDFELGMSEARRKGRPAFVYFDADWCSWCQQYKRQTLGKEKVLARLSSDYVPVLVDYDARPDLMRRYGGVGLPFTVVLSPDEQVLHSFVGIVKAEDLLNLLDAVDKGAKPQAAPQLFVGETIGVDSLDHAGYDSFRDAYLQHLEALYDPQLHTLAGRFESGATLKRPSPLTWIYLMDHGLWPQRVRAAAGIERRRLLDRLDGGFFNFLDPSRGGEEYLETSKLLEANAWLSAWLAQVGVEQPAAHAAALSGWLFLREVLWDPQIGGFWQAQVADNEYYARPPRERLRAAAPPLDRAKRTDTNAQAAWALTRFAHFARRPVALDYAAGTVDFILREMTRDGRLFHIRRGGELIVPALPEDRFWLLVAGAKVDQSRPDERRRVELSRVASVAADWLRQRMNEQPDRPLSAELAGLVAWVAGMQDRYPQIPAEAREWALRKLRMEPETPPDELVMALWAWERRLDLAAKGHLSNTTFAMPRRARRITPEGAFRDSP